MRRRTRETRSTEACLKRAPWRIDGPPTNADDLAASIKRIQDDVRKRGKEARGNSHERISTYNPNTQEDIRAGQVITAKSQDPDLYAAEDRMPGDYEAVDHGAELTNVRTPWHLLDLPEASGSSSSKQ